MRSRTLIAISICALLAACGGGRGGTSPSPPASPTTSPGTKPEILPLLVSSEITKGPNRFLFSLTDQASKLVAAPNVKVHLRFYNVDVAPDTVVFEADATFFWAVENQRGLYRAAVTFPSAGRWGTRFEATFPDGSTKAVRADYDVRPTGTTPAIGAKVPSVATPTLADVGGTIAKVSTDKAAEPRFYQTSIASALAAGKPFAVAFATPAFCETALCGPTLDIFKAQAAAYPGLTFIHVEPYQMAFTDGRLQPVLDAQGQLQAAAWTDAWGLQSEPQVFVVRADGTLLAKFEGALGADELRAALGQL